MASNKVILILTLAISLFANRNSAQDLDQAFFEPDGEVNVETVTEAYTAIEGEFVENVNTEPQPEQFEEPVEPIPEQNETVQELPPSNSIKLPFAYSPLFLTYLAKMERDVYSLMTDYENGLMERLQIIRRYVFAFLVIEMAAIMFDAYPGFQVQKGL